MLAYQHSAHEFSVTNINGLQITTVLFHVTTNVKAKYFGYFFQ